MPWPGVFSESLSHPVVSSCVASRGEVESVCRGDGLAPLPEPIEPNRISSCQMKKKERRNCSKQVKKKRNVRDESLALLLVQLYTTVCLPSVRNVLLARPHNQFFRRCFSPFSVFIIPNEMHCPPSSLSLTLFLPVRKCHIGKCSVGLSPSSA